MVQKKTLPAHPTLWRTCRALANRLRLRLLQHLFHRSDQSVSEVARALKVRRSVTTQYLRALNARGLLGVRRVGRWVYYRPAPDDSILSSTDLLSALRRTFEGTNNPIDEIFLLSTAFTHPRREKIYRALSGRGLTLKALKEETGISSDALRRHLNKLRCRGFIRMEGGIYRACVPESPLARVLVRLAVTSRE
ncbi:MAG: helix-turn-helix domain-containing protein [Planctomycetes bacterium]|nr:helix-turn-helix domain-containing protein [Planctomycetota bacterium]